MKFKLLMLALALSATGIATAMVSADADRSISADADAIAVVLTPDGYAHAASFSHLSQAGASFGIPALALIEEHTAKANPDSEFRSQALAGRFLLAESDSLSGLQVLEHPHDSAWRQTMAYSAAVTASNDITQDGYYSAAFQLSPHVPEPQTWAMLLASLGLIGLQLRRANRARMVIN
jgi:hypothetical protein